MGHACAQRGAASSLPIVHAESLGLLSLRCRPMHLRKLSLPCLPSQTEITTDTVLCVQMALGPRLSPHEEKNPPLISYIEPDFT